MRESHDGTVLDAGVRERVRPNRLFGALAQALGFTEAMTELLLADLMARFDATPGTLTLVQLWAMRPGLFQVIDGVVPPSDRDAARTRVCLQGRIDPGCLSCEVG